jgi:hypothetical protein
VRLGVFAPEIMRIVGCDDTDAQLAAEPQHALGDDLFVRNAVLLNLEPEPLRTEHRGKPFGALLCLVVFALAKPERHLTREAGREANDPLVMLLQHLAIDSRTAIKPFGEANGREPHQIAIADAIRGQQHEMAVRSRGPRGLLLFPPGAEGQIRLEAENRADALRLRLLVEAPGGVEISVIGDGQAVHAQLLDVLHQLGDPIGAVEQGVFAVGVEVNESHVFLNSVTVHAFSPSAPAPATHRQPSRP